MSAIAIYITQKPFLYEGRMRKIGSELALDSREADEFVKKNLLKESRFLDPDDKEDQEKIKEIKQKMTGKKESEIAAEKARDKKRDSRLAAEDEKKAKLVTEAKDLIVDDGENNIEKLGKEFEAMTIPQLEASIEDMKTREKKEPEEEKEEKKDTESKPKEDAAKTADTSKTGK